mmetsp:Transcript_28155/g.42397  ORF Transcript_28155/g.42397 Transcript_28155/m.42397 type:complete len:210 (-) Transcript_28155:792-1421(-)
MAALIFSRCALPRAPELVFRFLKFSIIEARNSGSSHFCFRVSAIRLRTDAPTTPEATVLLVINSLYSESSAHLRFRDSRIFCFVSSECLKPLRTVLGSRGLRLISPLAYFSFSMFDIFFFVSSVGVYPPFAVLRARRSASFFRLSAFFLSLNSSSVIPSSASFARNRSRFLRRTPSAMRALTSSERVLPLFQGVLPLLAADILALDAEV